MLKKKNSLLSVSKNRNKGLTLIEIVVTIAVLAIATVVLISSYTNMLEDQRMKADMATLNNIDVGLKQILMYDDAFEEVADCVYDKNKLSLKFNVSSKPNSVYGYIDVESATINGDILVLKDSCPILCQYLMEYIGEEIELTSASYKKGYYRIDVEFNGTQVSDVRDYVISNDVIIITNSGDAELTSY